MREIMTEKEKKKTNNRTRRRWIFNQITVIYKKHTQKKKNKKSFGTGKNKSAALMVITVHSLRPF
jgi:hypothetical protein